MWENMGDPIDNERKVKLKLATFEGLINSIDDLKCERTGEKGELVQWRVELFHGDKLGYITALPIDDMLYIRFYRMEGDVPRKRIIIGNKDGMVWDSGPDELGDMHLVAGSDDVWESKQAISSAAPYILVRKVDMALASYGAIKAQAHQVNSGKEHGLNTAQIFLSYAREDEERVEQLYQKLSDAGFKPWMAKKDLVGGERWKSRISQAIRRSDLFLACLSANSVDKRGFVQREIKDALDIWREKLESDIYLIPVRLEDCEVLESLRDFHWVNLFEEDGLTRLVEAIQAGMKRRIETPIESITPSRTPPPAPRWSVAQIGDTISEVGLGKEGLSMTLIGWAESDIAVKGPYKGSQLYTFTARPGMKFIILGFEFHNNWVREQKTPCFRKGEIRTDKGYFYQVWSPLGGIHSREYAPRPSTQEEVQNLGGSGAFEDLLPEKSVRGHIVFEIPKDEEPEEVELSQVPVPIKLD